MNWSWGEREVISRVSSDTVDAVQGCASDIHHVARCEHPKGLVKDKYRKALAGVVGKFAFRVKWLA